MKSAAHKAQRATNGKAKRQPGAGRSVHVRKAKPKVVGRVGKKPPTENQLKKVFVDAASDARAQWVWFE